MSMTELEAARFVRAALGLIHDSLPESAQVRKTVSEYAGELDGCIEALEQGAPPWEPDAPEIPLTWAEVSPGDSVLAPNGQWYKVDAWSRTGPKVSALLMVNGVKVKTDRLAAERVTVRRGPEGRALDVFAAAGMKLERIGR